LNVPADPVFGVVLVKRQTQERTTEGSRHQEEADEKPNTRKQHELISPRIAGRGWSGPAYLWGTKWATWTVCRTSSAAASGLHRPAPCGS